MSIKLTLDVFSGRPNPEIEVDKDRAEELLDALTPDRLLREEEGEMPQPILGYRGIVVQQTEVLRDDLPETFRLAGGSVLGKGLAHRVSDRKIEDHLTGPDGPFAELEIEAEDFFGRVEELRHRSLELWKRDWFEPPIIFPWPLPCKCGPIYEPGWWNVPSRQPHNNCYNYGTNYRTDTFAQPGKAANAQYTSLTCKSVRPAAIADKLIDAPNADNQCPAEGHLVALVVAPGWDYHWYRKDRTGWWSHKPGGTAVTDRDNSGNRILDPRNADRGPYTDFCTFMVVMHGHIKIR